MKTNRIHCIARILSDLNIVKTFIYKPRMYPISCNTYQALQISILCLLIIDLFVWFRPSEEQGHDIMSVAAPALAGDKRLEVV